MVREYRLETTVEPQKLKQVFALASTEWTGPLSPGEFADIELKLLVDLVLKGNPGRAFYLQSKSGDIVASCIVTQHKALFKEAGVSTVGIAPDPSLFGVNNVTAIRLSFVFVAKEARGQDLMGHLILKAIEYTEAEILKRELAKSSDAKDSFKLMVRDGHSIDRRLVLHYVGKKYVWYLYSAIGQVYARFGFKAYPVEGYRIDRSLSRGETYSFVEKLLSSEGASNSGKKLRLLDGTRQADRDLMDQIFLGKQLELLTDLNKNVYHSELQGDLRSSLSLTNLSSALHSSKPDSFKDLSAISMSLKETVLGISHKSYLTTSTEKSSKTQERARSSILLLGCPKFAILPDLPHVDEVFKGTRARARKAGSENTQKYATIYGAILTNELQKKSFYVLWMLLKGMEFTIVAMGELNVDLFGAMADPLGLTNPIRSRRSASFTAINEMGGFNFQDLDLLVSTAVYVAQQQALTPEQGTVLVNLNDLPTSIPKPVLHDFFLNYLPKAYVPQESGDTAAPSPESAPPLVTFHENFSEFGILPMLKKYGNTNGDFELDWVANSLITWG